MGNQDIFAYNKRTGEYQRNVFCLSWEQIGR